MYSTGMYITGFIQLLLETAEHYRTTPSFVATKSQKEYVVSQARFFTEHIRLYNKRLVMLGT